VGERWRGFKTQLINDYITKPSEDCRPVLEMYPFLQKHIWEKFMESRNTPEFKVSIRGNYVFFLVLI